MLEGEEFKVDSFNDPQLALSNFTPGTYDVALIDTKMPKMNGFDLYKNNMKALCRKYLGNCQSLTFILAFCNSGSWAA